MVLEIRKIMLSKGELAMALNGYGREYPGYLPVRGKVIHCDFPNAKEVSLEVEIEHAQMERAIILERTKMDLLKLTEPLIHFCIDNNIKLPRKGKKQAILSQGIAALFVELETFPVLDFD